jgi:pyrroline-5-carboxylate reductase
MTDSRAAHRIAFIGAGRMATALAKGMLEAAFVAPEQVCASDVSETACRQFEAATGCPTRETNAEAASDADVVVLAVKPQVLSDVLAGLAPHLALDQLVISIVAGVTLETLSQQCGHDQRLVRVMPNTPCLVGCGASAFARGEAASAADADFVRQLLETVGVAFEVPEHLLDAVTGLSGSGPAFVFQVIEALGDGGVRAGLPRSIAATLAAQTVLGAARMVLETEEHPAALKDAVTSPGGTTIAGLHELERGGLRAAILNAVLAAAERSGELGRS